MSTSTHSGPRRPAASCPHAPTSKRSPIPLTRQELRAIVLEQIG